jgi:hypothetical protein
LAPANRRSQCAAHCETTCRFLQAPNATELSPDDRFLEGVPGVSRVLMATRFNLSNKSNDVRYLMLDQGASFHIVTDDFGMLKRGVRPQASDSEYAELCSRQISELAAYADLSSAAAALIYLPAFLITQASSCSETEFLTELGVEGKEPRARRILRVLGKYPFSRRRTVHCLSGPAPDPGSLGPSDYRVRPPELTFDTRGFWKPLGQGLIGAAPDGTPVVGKTWVQRTEAWESSSPEEFLARRRRAPDQGSPSEYIYVIRSPGHAADLYKVGMTRREVSTRADELTNSTAAPLPFGVLASWAVMDASAAERAIHDALAPYRVSSRREFFRVSLPVIIRIIDGVVALQSHGRAD